MSPEELAQRDQVAIRKQGGDPIHTLTLSDCRAKRVPPFLFEEFSLCTTLVSLDLSRNQLRELPAALGGLASLQDLNVSRNFLKRLPGELSHLTQLLKLNASSNGLRPTTLSLEALAALPGLRVLDLTYNNKISEAAHAELLRGRLAMGCECLITLKSAIFEERTHASDRDATHMESQLAPFSTGTLRRRLAIVFGDTTDPDKVERPELMSRLLEEYTAMGPRAMREIEGKKVAPGLCAALLEELERWSTLDIFERPTIKAEQYMILTSLDGFTVKTGTKAMNAARKIQKHPKLWSLAHEAIMEVDPAFASTYTAVAYTRNFVGSPHIDTQNTGCFYGLALGDFSEGGGKLCVECSAREVAQVDTRGRLGKVDGRYPHWVAPYTGTRFSVIYYQTLGTVTERTTAVFEGETLVDDPPTFTGPEDRYYNCYCRETNTYSPSV